MNIILIITNLAGGGAEKVLLTLAEGLSNRGHTVELILLEEHIEHALPPKLTITVLSHRIKRSWLGKRRMAQQLKRLIGKRAIPDLIVSALPFANEIAILADLPNHWCRIDNTLGVEVDKLAANNPRKARRRLNRYRHLYNQRPLIAISNGMVDDLRQRIGISSHIVKITNPFDQNSIHQQATEPCLFRPHRPYVIHAGRFNAQKRHDILLDAWKVLDTGHILVLLTKSDPALIKIIEEKGLSDRVFIAGFQTNPYPWIAGADLLVLSSDHEGLGGVLIEALICKTPAISTNCPSGPSEILAEFPECLVPCGDAPALANAMRRCLTNPPNLDLADISKYSLEKTLPLYEQLATQPTK